MAFQLTSRNFKMMFQKERKCNKNSKKKNPKPYIAMVRCFRREVS